MISLLVSIAAYTALFLGGLVAALYLFFQHKFKTWKKLNVPYLEPSFPFGNTPGMATSKAIGTSMREVYENGAGKPFYGIYSFCMPLLIIRDPELVKAVFVKDFMSFHDRGIYVNEKDDPLSGHLFSIGGSKWRFLRTKLSPTFTSGKMKMMFPILVENSHELVDVLKEPARQGQEVEVKEYAARFTTDIISSCAFGLKTNSLRNPNAEFRVMGKKVLEPESVLDTFKGTINSFWPEMAEFLKLVVTKKDVTKFFMGAVEETITYRKENKVKRDDFMQLLIQLMEKGRIEDVDEKTDNSTPKTDETRKFTFDEAAAQAFVFFLAGFETSSTTMQFALYELALNPDIQESLREEILRVLEDHDNKITYEAIYEMDLLGRVIDETLRKYPPVPVLFRECAKPYKLPNTDIVIPPKTLAHIPIIGLHYDPKYYPDPEKFDPDRFTEEVKSKRHHYAYLPFGEGPRNCIGMRFGLMQTRVGLITLLSHYRFEIGPSTPVPMVYDHKTFILTPAGEFHLKISNL